MGDRVTELYRGEIFTDETQRICRHRIHWIVSQVEGRRIFDVGCSQGIVSLLLAQEGFEVQGVDVDPKAIAFAEAEREKLAPEVASRVGFHLADITTLEPEGAPFDTLVLGEFLEHFAHPERILEICLGHLGADGRVVITVPFGSHPHEDHRTTFTLSRFLEMVEDRVAVEHLDVVDGYVRFVGSTGEPGSGVPDLERLLRLTEDAVLDTQERMFRRLAGFRDKLEVAQSHKEAWRIRATGTAERLEAPAELLEVRLELKEAHSELERLEMLVERQDQELEVRDRAFRREHQRAEAAHGSLRETRAEVLELKRELAALSHSTTYRIGSLVTSARNPWRLMKLPFQLTAALTRALWRRLRRRSLEINAARGKEELERLLEEKGFAKAARWLEDQVRRGRANEGVLVKILFSLAKDSHTKEAITYGDRAVELYPDDLDLAAVVAVRHRRLGHERRAEDLEDRIEDEKRSTSQPSLTMSFSQLKTNLRRLLEEEDLAAAEKWALRAQEQGWADELLTQHLLFALTRRQDPRASLRFGERAYELSGDTKLLKALISQYRSLGRIRRALELSTEGETELPDGDRRRTRFLRGQVELLKRGFSPPVHPVEDYSPRGDRAFYLLHNSLPFSSGGYATRSHGLAAALRDTGVDLEAVTRLGFPYDIKNLAVEEAPEAETIDGVPYLRLLTRDQGYGATPLPRYLADYTAAVVALAQERRPAIIHGASNYMNGVVANAAARNLDVPSIYEVRGLWEITRISRHPEWEDSDFFHLLKNMEAQAAREATAVVTITQALRRELVSRGVEEDKITVIPNAVDSVRFVPRDRDRELEERLGLAGKTVIGYVGSFVDYEGLDDLVEAVAILRARGREDFFLLLVGDGVVMEDLEVTVEEYGVGDVVHFAGRVPHEEVESYYSLVDVAPFPRKPVPVCEIVSPLKPFEAMSMEKAVLASDVGALAEIVDDGATGRLFRKGDLDDLVRVLDELLDDPEQRARLGKEARRWVVRERNWPALAARLRVLYDELVPTLKQQREVG